MHRNASEDLKYLATTEHQLDRFIASQTDACRHSGLTPRCLGVSTAAIKLTAKLKKRKSSGDLIEGIQKLEGFI